MSSSLSQKVICQIAFQLAKKYVGKVIYYLGNVKNVVNIEHAQVKN